MSIYYNPRLVRLLMDERVREARQVNSHCCMNLDADEPKSSFRSSIRGAFRRQSPADCTC